MPSAGRHSQQETLAVGRQRARTSTFVYFAILRMYSRTEMAGGDREWKRVRASLCATGQRKPSAVLVDAYGDKGTWSLCAMRRCSISASWKHARKTTAATSTQCAHQ